MAVNEAYLDASPEDIWDVLSDPYAYPRWVVGSKRTVEADPQWPQPGAEFRVEVGAGPLNYTDRTVCKAIEPGRRIALHAGGGGVAGADVEITLSPSGTGTVVTMLETPGGWSAPLRSLVPLQWAIKARNVESLRRLKRLAEARRQSAPAA
jgi:uncharacterized protein YndB with AHSA1/START domain